MKDKTVRILKLKFIASLITILVLTGVVVNYFTAGEESVITKVVAGAGVIQTAEEPEIAQTHTVYMLVNELHVDDERSLGGSEIKLTPNSEELTVSAYNVESEEEISPNEDGNIVVPEKGIKVKVEGIKENSSYEIEIESKKTGEDYRSTFKKAVIEIDATSEGKIEGYVKTITRVVEGEETTSTGSIEKTAIFMYEDESNKIKIKGNGEVKIYYIKSGDIDGLTEEEIASKTEEDWNLYNEEEGIIAENNCVIYARSKYKTGEYSEISEIIVNNIDKIAPEMEVTPSTIEVDDETEVEVRITENENKLYGKSGIIAYTITEEEAEPSTYTEVEATNEIETQIGEIAKNGTYYLWAKDKAGNVSHTEFEVTNIKHKIVAIILESPVSELVGTEYESLNQLVAVLEEKGLTKTSQKTVIQIVNDIRDESTKINNKNLEIDLNGYSISSKSATKDTLELKNSNVVLVDNKYDIAEKIEDGEKVADLTSKYSSKKIEGVEQNGKVCSENYNAVEISNDSVFTLGEDDRTINVLTPTIEAAEVGVKNNGGTFNYYDGILIGRATSDGTTVIEGETVDKAITDTPTAYDPSTTLIDGEERFKTVLARISGIEAVIGKTRYTTLEGAIAAANDVKGTPETQVQIDIVTDINKTASVEVNSTKNIKLNLNSYSITNSIEDYVFKNYGKMEIVDNTQEQDIQINMANILKSDDTQYGFDYNGTSLVANNIGVHNSVADSYIEIDLTDRKSTYEVTVNAEISSENNYDKGYAAITTSTTNANSSTKFINNISGSTGATNYKTTLQPGSKYYLHFGYTKDGSKSSGQDSLIINSITCKAGDPAGKIETTTTNVIKNTEGAELTLTSGTILQNKGGSSSSYIFGITNSGNLIVNGGVIKANKNYVALIGNINGGTVEINGGKITNTVDYTYGVWHNGTEKVKMANGTIEFNNAGTGIYNNNNGIVEISGGNITAYHNVIYNKNVGTVKITEGNLTSKSSNTIYNNNSQGVIEIYGGTIKCSGTSSDGIYNEGKIKFFDGNINAYSRGIECGQNGSVEMSGGNITVSNGKGIYNYGSGKVEVSGGTITTNGSGDYAEGIDNYSNGTIEVSGGTITAYVSVGILNESNGIVKVSGGSINANSKNGIYNKSTGTVTIKDGTINSTSASAINNGGTGTIIIGEKDGIVKETLVITGGKKGVNNACINGKVYYYDGIIKGKDEAILGVVNEIEDNKGIILNTDETYEIARLENIEKIAYVGEDETNTFDALEAAITACGNEGKITLLKNIVYVTGDGKVIPENTKITLNLNRKTIKTHVYENFLTNNGELKITDLSEEKDGKITCYGKDIILNGENKKLDIENGIIEFKQIYSESYAYYTSVITNNGTMNITGGNISTTTDYSYAVNSSGTLEMSGGNISTTGKYGYGIKATGTANVKISNSGSITTNGERGYGITNSDESKIEMTGGSITTNGSRGYAIISYTTDIVKISDGTITTKGGDAWAVCNVGTGKLEMTGGTVVTTGNGAKGIFNETTGEVVFSGGSIETQTTNYDGYGIQNCSTGTITITGGTINTKSSRGYGVVNSSTGSIEITGGNITTSKKSGSDPFAIYNESTGVITITGGNIKSTYDTGIYNKGTITLGEKDGNVRLVPTITGGTYGVQNVNGTFNFYDGIIKGKENKSISGVITEMQEGYSKQIYKNGESAIYDIGSGNEVAVLEASSVAVLESTGETPYPTLRLAVETASETDKITLTNNITITELESVIEISKNIILDLNGHTINAGNENMLTISGTLTITDGTETKNGKIISEKQGTSTAINSFILNNGTLNIEDVNIETAKDYNYLFDNTGILNITGGNIKSSPNSDNGYCINNRGTGTINISGGQITARNNAIINRDNSNIEMTGGTITRTGTSSSNSTIHNLGTGTVTIIDGTITVSSYKVMGSGIENDSTGTIIIKGGIISTSSEYGCCIENTSTGTVRIENVTRISGSTCIENTGTLEIQNGTIDGRSYAIKNSSTGSVEITGGNITADSKIIENSDTGSVEITGGTLTSTGYVGIINKNTAELIVTGGSIIAKNTVIENSGTGNVIVTGGEITSSTEIGLYNSSIGTITIGEKDGIVNNIPVIKGETNSVVNDYKNGKLYFYDGILKSKQETILGIVNEIEDNKQIVLTNDENYEIAQIGDMEDIAYVGEDETNTYNSLGSAMTACGQEGKITLLKNIAIPTGREISTPNNSNITLNLNGKEIRTYAYENTITNNGELTITDLSNDKTGKIGSYGKCIIVNEVGKTISVEEGTIQLLQVNGDRNEYLSCMNNKGTLNVTGGNIICDSTYVCAVKNSGNVQMTGGNIKVNSSSNSSYISENAIRSLETGTENITGGNIISSGAYSRTINKEESTGILTFGGTAKIVSSGSSGYAIYAKNANVQITGGTIEGNRVYNSNAILTVEDGNISGIENYKTLNIQDGTIGWVSTYKTATITNATINGTLKNGSNGTLNIEDVNVNATDTGILNYGTMIIEKGTVTGKIGVSNSGASTIEDITVTGSNGYGINNSGTITIKKGTIKSETSDGIYNTKTLTLGENDSNTPSKTNPEIIGKRYGVNNTKTFNYYDGIIKGETSAINGTVTDTPIINGTEDKYTVVYPKGDKTEAILGIEAVVENTIELDGEYSSSLAEALLRISNKASKTGTIKINNSFILNSSVTVPTETNVTIVLQGNTITYNGSETAIINNGTLTVIDFEDVTETSLDEISVIKSNVGTTIENNGTLVLGQVGSNNTNSPKIIGSTAITGNSYTTNSGSVVNTETGATRILKQIKASQRDYATGDETGNGERVVLSTSPEMKANSKLPTWSKTNVKVTAQADTIPVLNLYLEDRITTANYYVEYYYDGTKDNTKTYTEEKTIGDEITSYPNKNITGYKLDRVENLPLTITSNEDENVIKVYYVKDTYGYTVHYFYDGTEDASKKETLSGVYGSEVTEVPNKVITGYKHDTTETLPMTITENAEDNVINVYYVKDTYGYTVHYFYDGTEDTSKKETLSGVYGSEVTEVPNKVITGYKHDRTETLPMTIGANAEENIVNVYYVKDTFGYTVHYFYDGTEDTSKKETLSGVYGSEVTEVPNKVITGYKHDRTETLPMTIGANAEENVINVYYVKDTYGYTVHYFYEGTEDTSKKETLSGVYGSEVTEVPNKVITGYKHDRTETLPMTITENAEENVINVYYVKDTFEYTIEYYYGGEIDNSKTETESALYQSVITESDIEIDSNNIEGYKFEKTENLPLIVSENEENNVIKVYYIIDDENTKTLSYTVEYYKDGEKVVQDTQTERKTVQILEPNTMTVDKTKINTIDKYTGYKLQKTEPSPIPTTVNNGDVIKVYYVKDTFGYTVHYFYEGTEDTSKKETLSGVYGSEVTEVPNKVITGYKHDRTETLPMTITENAEENVVNVYYVKDTYGYTVHYFYDRTEDISKKETLSGVYGSEVTEVPNKNITGYKHDRTETLPMTITENAEENVINVYYVKDTYGYTVHYFYDGTEDTSKRETLSGVYGSEVTEVPNKVITGYKHDRTETLPMTIGANAEENVVNVYYVKDTFGYTVHYFYDGTEDTSKKETLSGVYGSEVTEVPNKVITGYKHDRTETLPMTIGANAEENVVNVYYVKDTFGYTVHYFYDGTEDTSKKETLSGVYGSEVTEVPNKVITGYKHDRTETLPMTITENTEDNVINVYYVKDTFEYTIEYYYGGEIDNSKTETESALYQSVITESDIEIDSNNIEGYRFEKTENLPLTVSENAENNIIKVYYIIDDGNTKTLSYTVEYYKDGEKVVQDTQTERKTVQILEPNTMTVDKTKINTTDKYTGYKLQRTEPSPIPTTVDNGDVIKVYYVKDNFNYRVEYYYNGTKDEEKTETESALYQSVITEDDIENKIVEGYVLNRIENTPLTISENEENNIIKVYYLKQYTIKVKHIDKYTNELKEEETIIKTKGEEYRTEAKQYEGYDLDKIPENAEGTAERNEEVKYYYRKQVKIEIRYIDKETGKDLLEKVVKEGHQGDIYEIEGKEIKYFRLEEKPETEEGEMQEDATYTYYYEPLKFNLKVVNAITRVEKDESESNIEAKLAKTEIHRKKLDEAEVKVELKIEVTNDGELDGKATLVQKIPSGFEMEEEDNEGWTIDDRLALIEIGKIKVGETKEYKVVLTWVNGEENIGIKDYVTYITNTENEAGRKEESMEDNEASSTLILSVSTGEKVIKVYAIASIILVITVLILVAVRRKKY